MISRTTELRVRPATLDDTNRILGLLRLSLGEGKIPRERSYWDWKHRANPFGESALLVAEADTELVGLRAFMRWDWTAGGTRMRSVRAVDTATHPDWQGRGIFSNLTRDLVARVAEDGTDFIFNTPNEKSRPGYLKMGWKSVGKVDLWIRPSRPLALLTSKVRRTAADDSMGREGRFCPGFEIGLDDALDRLLVRRASMRDDRLSTARSAAYLGWRYREIPEFRYHLLAAHGGDPSAAIVFRYARRGPLLELRVCEILLDGTPESVSMAGSLLRRISRESGADFVSAMGARGTPERAALLRSGFLPAPRVGPILTVRQLDPAQQEDDLVNRRRWCLMIGDLELF